MKVRFTEIDSIKIIFCLSLLASIEYLPFFFVNNLTINFSNIMLKMLGIFQHNIPGVKMITCCIYYRTRKKRNVGP